MKRYKDTDYFVDEQGNVYKFGKKVKTYLGSNCYLNFNFSFNGFRKLFLVHRIIAETYIKNPDNLPYVNHKNGNKLDNRIENLEWTSPSENVLHKINYLKKGFGEKIGTSKLTQKDIDWIRENHKFRNPEYNTNAIAKKFGVSRACIHKIIHYQTWFHKSI